MLSLHHDSVQDQFLRTAYLDGQQRTFTTYAQGYSIFISRDNAYLNQSKRFALWLGQELRTSGLKPTMHHHEKIAGENRPIVDSEAGVFFYDRLIVLHQTAAPAVLLESAVITNPDDEQRAQDPAYRSIITNAILAAVVRYCASTN
jgi:N-acetylmuramoyl-L-alanine amidase